MSGYLGAAEVAELLGISRQRVQVLTKRDTFPQPIVVLAMGPVWDRDEVLAWAEATGRTHN